MLKRLCNRHASRGRSAGAIFVLGALFGLGLAGGLVSDAEAQQQPSGPPPWLQAHVGYADGQIAPVVLYRARELYLSKLRSGKIRNACYFAMDATRPNGVGQKGRFYIICEAQQIFRVMSSGHGNGRNIPGIANFANGLQCSKHFSNAYDSLLTTGGPYVTAELKDSFKGVYRTEDGQYQSLVRTFIQFDGEGETATARTREIGGHPSVTLRWQCRMKAPRNAYADREGYVPYGSLYVYTGGRSNGCTSWSSTDAQQITAMVKNNPTTVYIYPESRDIVAVGRGDKRAYWNATCLKAIGKPNFWPRETLEPAIARWKASFPKVEPKPLPVCR